MYLNIYIFLKIFFGNIRKNNELVMWICLQSETILSLLQLWVDLSTPCISFPILSPVILKYTIKYAFVSRWITNLYIPLHLKQPKMLYSAAVNIRDVQVHAHTHYEKGELVLCVKQWAQQYTKTASLLQFVFLQ